MTQELPIAHACLVLRRNGKGVLILRSWAGTQARVYLPASLASVVYCLAKRHKSSDPPHASTAFISCKEIARALGLDLRHIYDIKSYVYKIRRRVSIAVKNTGIARSSFVLIASEMRKGYAINQYLSVSVRET